MLNTRRPFQKLLVSLIVSSREPHLLAFSWEVLSLSSALCIHLVTLQTKLLCLQLIPGFFPEGKKPLGFSSNKTPYASSLTFNEHGPKDEEALSYS